MQIDETGLRVARRSRRPADDGRFLQAQNVVDSRASRQNGIRWNPIADLFDAERPQQVERGVLDAD